jgi:hypothetical protein
MANMAIAQEVKINTDFTVKSDGTVLLTNGATTFNDIVVNPYIAKIGNTSPLWAQFLNTNIYTWFFEDSKTQDLTFSIQLPHNYKEGTMLYPHVHWSSATAAGTSRVKWNMEYQWINHMGVFDPAVGATITGSAVAPNSSTRELLAYEHIITPIGTGISGTSMQISSILMCRIYRDGNNAIDTFTGSAAILSIDFHYEIDAFGSNEQYVK